MVCTITPYLLKTADNPDGVDRSVFDEMLAALEQDRPSYFAASAPPFFGAGASPEIVKWGIGLALQASPKATLDMVRTFSETDHRPDLPAVTVPTLIVHGDADLSAPLELTGRRTAQAIPGSRLEVYPGASHGLFFTAKERLNRDLLQFIR
jgi:pimeloyl-ACP methyl ester carboxylesterase